MKNKRDFYRIIRERSRNKTSFALTVLSEPYAGEKALADDRHLVWNSSEDGFFCKHAKEAGEIRETGICDLDGQTLYVEKVGSQKKLVICGAGHVSVAIIKIARLTGFYTICIDDRNSFAEDAKAAGADEVICDDFIHALERIPGGTDTGFIIVTRGHAWDRECLRAISWKQSAYVGMMGSRQRVEIVKNMLEETGVSREFLDGVHTPIGLKIGAETPEEIAVSILAEVIQIKNERKSAQGYPREILSAIADIPDPGADERFPVLATIISKKGSAPRAVGTKMLILPDGKCVGTIGGGRVEAEVMQRGKEFMAERKNGLAVCTVNLANDAAAEEGMVCGGQLEVLLERV